jgi:hypothetical protein
MPTGLFERYRHIGNGFFVTENEAWAVLHLPSSYHTYDQIPRYEEHATAVTQALNAVFPDEGELRIQLRTIRVPFDVDEWTEQVKGTVNTGRINSDRVLGDRFTRYIERMSDHVRAQGFLDRATYLLISIETRDISETRNLMNSMRRMWDTFRGTLAPLGLPTDPGVSDTEAAHYEQSAHHYAHVISSKLPGARAAIAQEIVALIRAPFARRSGADTIPDLDTFPADAIASVIDEQVTFGRDVIEHTDENETFYSAIVSVGVFPEHTDWPKQMSWFSIAESYAPDAEVTITANILSAREVLRRLDSVNTKTQEQLEDAEKYATSDTRKYSTHSNRLEAVRENVESTGNGWVEMTCRLHITARTAEEVAERRRRITKELREYGYIAFPDRYEQRNLFAEAMPGGAWQRGLHSLYYDINMIGATGCLLAYDVGDDNRAGMYLGHSLDGDATPVFFDPNRATQTNLPPGVLISGRPGMGKTFTALTLAYQAYVSGKTLVYLDPKADSEPLAQWLGKENINYINVTEAEAGLLDPFVMAAMLNDQEDPKLAHNSAVAVATMLTGIYSERRHKDAISRAVHSVIDAGLASGTQVTMMNLVDYLLIQTDDESRSLGAELSGFANDTFGRLLFSNGTARLEKARGRFTIIVMNGLSLPSSETPREEFTPEHACAMSVFYMSMMLAQRLMMMDALAEGHKDERRRTEPKVVIMDEAWALFATPEGRAAANSILRLGRSMNTAFAMVTQRPDDIPNSSTYISPIPLLRVLPADSFCCTVLWKGGNVSICGPSKPTFTQRRCYSHDRARFP